MLPNLDFHHPTTWWFDWGLPWVTRLLPALQLATTTGWSWSFAPLPQASAIGDFPLGFLPETKKNQPCVMSDDKDVLKRNPGGVFFLMKGKVRFQRFGFCVRLLFHHFESFKVPRLNSFPMFSKLFKRESQEKLEDGCVPNQSESQNDSKLDFFSSWVAMGCTSLLTSPLVNPMPNQWTAARLGHGRHI